MYAKQTELTNVLLCSDENSSQSQQLIMLSFAMTPDTEIRCHLAMWIAKKFQMPYYPPIKSNNNKIVNI